MVKALQKDNNRYCNHALVPVLRQCFVGLATEPTLHDPIPLAACKNHVKTCYTGVICVDTCNILKKVK
jgi:hypothetical protein